MRATCCWLVGNNLFQNFTQGLKPPSPPPPPLKCTPPDTHQYHVFFRLLLCIAPPLVSFPHAPDPILTEMCKFTSETPQILITPTLSRLGLRNVVFFPVIRVQTNLCTFFLLCGASCISKLCAILIQHT